MTAPRDPLRRVFARPIVIRSLVVAGRQAALRAALVRGEAVDGG